MGLRTPVGNTVPEFIESLKAGRSGICAMAEGESINRMRTKVAGVCDIAGEEKVIPRNFRRSMGRVTVMAVLFAIDAVKDTGIGEEGIASPACGVSFGSTAGSTEEQVMIMTRMVNNRSLAGVPASSSRYGAVSFSPAAAFYP
jgi:3-oxoacyl-(acyl-carrier-protein) synthase